MANVIEAFPNGSGSGGSLPAGGTTGQVLAKHSNADNDAEWVDASSGHTIKNSSGINMTQRSNLKFVGANVTDDSDSNSTVVTVNLDSKVDKVEGKGLSTNDYTDEDKDKIDSIDNKVDKIEGKGLSTNDYTTEEKTRLANITIDIDNKVDKVEGKGLSTEDYTTEEKTKLAGLSNYDDTAIKGRVKAIEDVVPSTATAANKLATMEDVAGIATDYDTLENRPQIAGTTLTGNKSLSDLGIQPSTLVTAKTIEGANVTTVQGVADATQTHTDKNVTDANGVHGFKADTSASRHDILYKSGNQWKSLNLKYIPQLDEMPEAIVGNVGKVIQYTGTTTSVAPIYKHGYVYECIASTVDNNTTYSWKNIELFDVQKIQQGVLPAPSAEELGNIYQYTGTSTPEYINGYYYECILDGSTYTWTEKRVQSAVGQVIQYDSMPTAKGSNVDRIIQYTGASTEDYTSGFFYKCVAQGTDPETYKWEETPVQASQGISQQDLATAEDVQDVKDTIDLMYGFDVLAHDEDVQAVKDIIDQINDFIPYYV